MRWSSMTDVHVPDQRSSWNTTTLSRDPGGQPTWGQRSTIHAWRVEIPQIWLRWRFNFQIQIVMPIVLLMAMSHTNNSLPEWYTIDEFVQSGKLEFLTLRVNPKLAIVTVALGGDARRL